MQIDFVYFDLGNVLVHFDHQIAMHKLASETQLDPALIRSALFDSGLEDRYETGKLSDRAFVAELSQRIGKPLQVDSTLETLSAIFTQNRDILPILERLKRSGFRLGILSNTCSAHWNWIRRQAYQTVEDWFEIHLLSFEVQSLKPSPEIYRAAAERCNVEPQRSFFTDDRLENVEAARRAGWNAVIFEDVRSLANSLDDWS